MLVRAIAALATINYSAKMVIYEVNLKVERNIWEEYAIWLKFHQEKMLRLEGFKSVKNFLLQPQDNRDSVQLSVHYEVDSLEKLESYFELKAEEMRSDALTRFGTQFSVTRRILVLQKDV